MVRAAAKNFHRVAALTDPADYPGILAELTENRGTLSLETCFALSQKAFRLTAGYDAAIAGYLGSLAASQMRAAYRVEAGGS
jgi:phosphoribosylaminoimidazolecarboxamide formyltransferase/IMP cyclohydrolase